MREVISCLSFGPVDCAFSCFEMDLNIAEQGLGTQPLNHFYLASLHRYIFVNEIREIPC